MNGFLLTLTPVGQKLANVKTIAINPAQFRLAHVCPVRRIKHGHPALASGIMQRLRRSPTLAVTLEPTDGSPKVTQHEIAEVKYGPLPAAGTAGTSPLPLPVLEGAKGIPAPRPPRTTATTPTEPAATAAATTEPVPA